MVLGVFVACSSSVAVLNKKLRAVSAAGSSVTPAFPPGVTVVSRGLRARGTGGSLPVCVSAVSISTRIKLKMILFLSSISKFMSLRAKLEIEPVLVDTYWNVEKRSPRSRSLVARGLEAPRAGALASLRGKGVSDTMHRRVTDRWTAWIWSVTSFRPSIGCEVTFAGSSHDSESTPSKSMIVPLAS